MPRVVKVRVLVPRLFKIFCARGSIACLDLQLWFKDRHQRVASDAILVHGGSSGCTFSKFCQFGHLRATFLLTPVFHRSLQNQAAY